jgi:aminoglycoside phosphotransferase (APT) family kinase protein
VTSAAADERENDLKGQLEAWLVASYGSACTVANVRSLGGHSGVTIGFDVCEGARIVERLVLKMPPAGVARKNNFDVLRQVPLLKALEAHDIPAPRARWWSDDESAFGGPYVMMSRLEGRSPPDLFRDEAAEGIANADALFDQAIDVLVDIHGIDTNEELSDWNTERDPDAEIEHWAKILQKTQDADWLTLGLEVRDLLHRTKPESMPHGLVHGDYYSNNWVFDGVRFSGVVDWEGTSIGPSLLDLGWIYMMYEPESWGPRRRATMHWQPDPERLVARYAERTSFDLNDLGWYRALAGYRLSCISAYYYEEHRSGRRRNTAWDMFCEAYPQMLGQAAGLLKTRAA